MLFRAFFHLAALSFVAGACQTTINVGTLSDTSQQNSDTGTTSADSGSEATSDPKTTGGSTGKPESTGTLDSTGKPDTTGTSDTSGKPDTTGDSTGQPDTTTSGDGSSTGDSTNGGSDSTSTGGTTDGSSSGSSTTGGGELLDGWTRYREILIDNSSPTEYKDLQVYVDIKYDGDMAPDYSDLRFTDASGSQLLPYWIEFDTGPANAYVWVRVPIVAADAFTTIRVYYGNPNASAGSNGADTFLFFESFDGIALDPLKWKATAPVTVDFGWLKISKGAVYSAKTVAGYPGTTLEARMKWTFEGGNPGASVLMASQGPTTGVGLKFIRRGRNFGAVFDGEKTLFQGALWDAMDMTAIMGVSIGETNSHFLAGHSYDLMTAPPLTFSYYAILGHIAGKNADMQETQNIDVDWVLVRRHAKPDPVCFVGGEKTP